MTSFRSSVDRLLGTGEAPVSLRDLAGILKMDPLPHSLRELAGRLESARKPDKVSCVRREPVRGAGPRIFEYGILSETGRVDQLPADVMRSRIQQGGLFYIRAGSRLASLVISRDSSGHETIQGIANGAQGDQLFGVPPCPGGQFIPPEFGDTPSEGDLSGEQTPGSSGPGDIPDPPDSDDPTSHHDGGD